MAATTENDLVPALEFVEATLGSVQNSNNVVLENIQWIARQKEYWVIIGFQGTGKSDLLAAAAGLMKPLSGTVRVLGRELAAGFEQDLLALRLQVALVFDGGRLLQGLTVAENIALPLRYHESSEERIAGRIEELLAFCELQPFAHSVPGNLRRAWQQRVALARALAMQPDILLLDSPLRGLDRREAVWWLDIMECLWKGHEIVSGKPLTIIATGDDLQPWRERAQKFGIIQNRTLSVLGEQKDLASHARALLQEWL